MGTALWKDFFREIRRSFNRFISIFAIVFIGVAFFVGVKATTPDMKYSMDQYYDEYNLMDIRIMSTLGLTNDDIKAIGSIDQVLDVQPGYFTDVVTTLDSTEQVIKIHSLPTGKMSSTGEYCINRLKLTQGRYPERSGECIVEESPFIDWGITIGDTIKVSSGKAKEITDGTLTVDEFKVVGKAQTPYYLSYEKGSSEIGSGKVDFFMMIPDYDFRIPVYTEALVTIKNAKELNSYNKDYEKLISKAVTSLDNLGVDRSGLRLDEIKKSATDELNKAKDEYNKQKQQFDEEIKNAEEQLSQAQMKLSAGEAQLATEKANFERNYSAASAQIAQGEKDLAAGEKEYQQSLAEYNQLKADYGANIDNLNTASQQLEAQRQQAQDQIAQLNLMLQDPNLTEEQRQSTQQLITMYETFLASTDQASDAVNDANTLGQDQMATAEAQLKRARAKLDQSAAELAAAKRNLAASKREADAKFAAARTELDTGWAEYNKNKAEYETKKAEGEKQLEDAREKIIRAEDEIEKLSKPQWYVLGRNSHYSYVDYGKTADRIDAIAKIFPVFFFLVATLVCLTTMTRMIDEQRGNIGAYKALGYSNMAIVLKYLLYAAVASLLGGILGALLGMKIFPEIIYKSWSMMYTLPPLKVVSQVPLVVISVLFGILVTALSALGACYRELKETPALLMRPKAPKMGKKILMERIHIIWKRLSFSQKVTARNLFRYKKRFLMTVIGIAGCTGMLLAGFGISDSISQVVNKQYKEIFTYSLNMKYKALATDEEKQRVMNILSGNDNVESYFACTEANAKARSSKDDISVKLIIPGDNEKFKDYVTLRERNSQNPIEIPAKGVIINEKLAKELNVGVGDAIELDNGDGSRKKVEIAGITENYVFHYAYMSADYYKEIYRLSPKINDLMVKLREAGADAESRLGTVLISDEAVGSVEYYSAIADTFEDSVKILNSIVFVLIISAGLLAFVVLYNLTNINIGERIREIATIKVLGFYNLEVSSYVYRENIILSIIGSLLGLLQGIILHRFIMTSLEQDGVMFGNNVQGMSFLFSFVITLIFAMLVNIFMYRRLTNIPMVESLKSVE